MGLRQVTRGVKGLVETVSIMVFSEANRVVIIDGEEPKDKNFIRTIGLVRVDYRRREGTADDDLPVFLPVTSATGGDSGRFIN